MTGIPLFRRYARQLFPHRVGNAQPQRGNDRRHQDKAGERIEPAGKAAGVILRPAPPICGKVYADYREGKM